MLIRLKQWIHFKMLPYEQFIGFILELILLMSHHDDFNTLPHGK